jgi:hypothetical protein
VCGEQAILLQPGRFLFAMAASFELDEPLSPSCEQFELCGISLESRITGTCFSLDRQMARTTFIEDELLGGIA